jgi:hypothetical protein
LNVGGAQSIALIRAVFGNIAVGMTGRGGCTHLVYACTCVQPDTPYRLRAGDVQICTECTMVAAVVVAVHDR